MSVDLGGNIKFADDGPSVSAGSASTDGIVLTTDDTEAKGGSDANAYGATANDSGALVAALLSAASGTAAYGADGQGAAATIGSFALNVVTADSGLTSGGSIIYLYNVAGVVVGSTTAPGDVTDDASITDNGVFTIAVSGAGVVTLTQTGAIDHLPNADASSYDELIALSDGKVTLSATVTVTDGDLDTASTPVSVDLGGNIKFADDGPSAAFTTKTVTVIHDETAGIDAGSNDVASIPAALVTAIAALTNGPAGAALGQATSGSALVADSSASVFGADGAASSNSLVMSLTNSTGGAFTGQDSGLDVTGGYSIFLYTENGLIVGREGSNDTTANPTGAVAFIVSLGSDGKITLVEYKAIEHPTPGTSHDESVSLTDLIYATVVATDGDGDTSTVTSDTALTVTFKDDGPSAPTLSVTENGWVTHDESAGLQNATATPSPAGDANDKDVAGSTAITFNGSATTVAALFSALTGVGDDLDVPGTGPLGYAAGGAAIVSLSGGSFGADGQAASGATTYALKVTNATFSGVSTTEGTQIFLYDNGSGVIVGRVGTEAGGTDTANPTGTIAFAITIDPLTGFVYMVQYLSLNHPLGGATNPDDSVSLTNSALQVTVTYKDGDGDTATSTPVNIGSSISFEDDAPQFTIINDGLDAGTGVSISAPNPATNTTYFGQFADWQFGADGAQATPTLSGVTGNVTIASSTSSSVILDLKDADGNLVAKVTLNADGTDSIEVFHRDPATETIPLLTSAVTASGPGATKIINSGDLTVTVTADDGTSGTANDLVNPSTPGWAVDNNTIDRNESIKFSFNKAVDNFSFVANGFTGNPSNNQVGLKITVYYNADGTQSEVFYVNAISGASIQIDDLPGFGFGADDSITTIWAVDVKSNTDVVTGIDIQDSNDGFRLNDVSVTTTSTTPPADLDFNFTLNLTDQDGDTAAQSFSIHVDGDAAGGLVLEAIAGTSGADVLTGTSLADVIIGGAGDDIITGGLGNDTLTGGLGADTFKWLLNETGVDTITDFNQGGGGVYNPAEGDVLDLAALLVGETGTASNLTNFLNFSESSGDTIIKIDVDGGGSFGTPDQTIVLQGVDLVTGAVDQTAIIQTLLTGGNLVTDIV